MLEESTAPVLIELTRQVIDAGGSRLPWSWLSSYEVFNIEPDEARAVAERRAEERG